MLGTDSPPIGKEDALIVIEIISVYNEISCDKYRSARGNAH